MTEWTEYSVVLAPSTAAGIGVFATHDITAGAYLFSAAFKSRKLRITDVPAAFIKYCIFIDDEFCTCPERFDRMEIGWYLNHSDKPNIAKDGQGNVIAVRDIKADEELFIDYNQLNEPEHLKEAYYTQSV